MLSAVLPFNFTIANDEVRHFSGICGFYIQVKSRYNGFYRTRDFISL